MKDNIALCQLGLTTDCKLKKFLIMKKRVAMKVQMILPSLLLQKPSAKSKMKEHSQLLEKRIGLWEEGKLTELWKEGSTIQGKLQTNKKKTGTDVTRIFSKLMFEGKVGAALKFLDEQAENSVLSSTPEVIQKLQSLHPASEDILPNTLFQGPLNEINPAIFYSIDEDEILKAAKSTNGSGGPSLMDAKQWRRMLCSNHFKVEGKELREELAKFARKISTEVLDPKTLETYTACRLLALDKSPGSEELQVRPIGVGEVMRRIVGKTIAWCLGDDIQKAAGPLQVSSGLKGGSEAAIHSMRQVFSEDSTDAIILVDAANAFNRLNRQAALHNIQFLCPSFATVLINTYRTPSRLFIFGGGEIKSKEGTTQGDTLAMQFYGISVTPIIHSLRLQVQEVSQVWLANDATAAGKIDRLRYWWDLIIKEGVKHGYFVKPTKSWLVLKNPDKLEEVKTIFKDCPINITTQGMRHLGAAIGSNEFKNSYINEKVEKWCQHITKLAEIANSEPHAAYAAFIHGEQHRYTYFLRTIAGIEENLKPLDEVISNKFIPALFGREITNNEREIIAMPVKHGGLGIRSVSDNSAAANYASQRITAPLVDKIIQQSNQLPSKEEESQARNSTVKILKEEQSRQIEETTAKQNPDLRRTLSQHSEPGASSWLNALPLEEQSFNLNKGEFRDALSLRYNHRPRNLPSKCPCGEKFDVTHALNCKRGGFVNARHDNIKNFEAKMLKLVGNDVEVEPPLQPVTGGIYQKSANTREEARPDVRARGFWRDGQNAYFDVRVTNPDCESQKNMTLKAVLNKHEQEKKRQYNQRIMNIEHGTFTPLIFTTT